jgi:hypothetical protein
VNKSEKKEENASTVRPGGRFLLLKFLEHYNHEGKLVGINIRVTSSLSPGRNFSLEKSQLKDCATWINRRYAIQRSQRNAFSRITNCKKVSKSAGGIEGNPALDCSARHDAIHGGWKSKYKPELNS